jgi:hypothetical protein
MTPERPRYQKPYEVFDISETEVASLRVTDEKLKETLANPNTTTHTIKMSTNTFGEFLFLTASRGSGQQKTFMTFYGLGFHKFRERWITGEWFWYQTQESLVDVNERLSEDEIAERLKQRQVDISFYLDEDTQTELGRMFEEFADMTDDDAAIAEMQDLGLL